MATNDNMNSVDNSEKVDEEQKIEEKNFYKLSEEALEKFKKSIQFHLSDENIYIASREISDSFKRFSFLQTDFSKVVNLVSYFYTHSILNMSVARHRFVDAFNNCKNLKEIIEKENLKVISLAGGPGTDIIGFLSAIQSFKSEKLKKIDVTIVDAYEDWNKLFYIFKELIGNKEANYGNVSNLFHSMESIQSSSIAADVVNDEQTKKYQTKLEEADVVLLVRFLDLFKFQDFDCDKFLKQRVLRNMKSGSFLFVIDSTTATVTGAEFELVYASRLERFQLSVPLRKNENCLIHRASESNAYIKVYKKI